MFIGETAFIYNTAIKGGAIWGSAGAQFNITSNSRFVASGENGTDGAIQCDSCNVFLGWCQLVA